MVCTHLLQRLFILIYHLDDDSGINWKNILLIGGIIIGVIIVIIIFIVIISVVCLKKPKQTFSRNASIESNTSVVTYE